MESISLEQALELKQLSTDLYESIELPWTWPGTRTIPGGILISLAVAAAFKTVAEELSINTVQSHFLAGADPEIALQQRVQRLNDSGRFATRVVTVEQGGRLITHVTCSFVRTAAMNGAAMTHTSSRATTQTIEKITLDDLEPGRNRQGSYMKFQRLPLDRSSDRPELLTYTSAALISPRIAAECGNRLHALGILCLSDYHVLDAPPTLHGLTFGLPHIDDHTRTQTYMNFRFLTTLNHTVHFRIHDDFRADEICYIEVNSPWASARRADVNSKIFEGRGRLIATCMQEAYYVMKEDEKSGKL